MYQPAVKPAATALCTYRAAAAYTWVSVSRKCSAGVWTVAWTARGANAKARSSCNNFFIFILIARRRARALSRAASGSRRRPKRHSSSEQSSAHCAVTSRATLAAGSRAARRSSAPLTSATAPSRRLCDQSGCFLTGRRSARRGVSVRNAELVADRRPRAPSSTTAASHARRRPSASRRRPWHGRSVGAA